jgi:hypothetical protein
MRAQVRYVSGLEHQTLAGARNRGDIHCLRRAGLTHSNQAGGRRKCQ